MSAIHRCQYKNELYDFICDESTIDAGSTFCIFHDINYLKGDNYEKHKEEVAKRLGQKISEYSSKNIPLKFIGYNLPEVSFEDKLFTEALYFIETTFYGAANFHGVTFYREAHFRASSFQNAGLFIQAKFSGEASFYEVTFSDKASFFEAQFLTAAEFDKAVASNKTLLNGAKFSREVNFRDSDVSSSEQIDEVDITPLHHDDPTKIDRLGRKPFAKSLALRLKRIKEENETAYAFFVHLHGPWGSGKTTLLKFLEEELTKKEEKQNKKENVSSQWIAVWFNAWQHQRASPAWWSVMDAVYTQSLSGLPFPNSLKLKMYENMWRIWNGISHRFFWPAVIMIIIAAALFFFDTGSLMKATQSSSKFLDFLQNRLGLVIASIVVLQNTNLRY